MKKILILIILLSNWLLIFAQAKDYDFVVAKNGKADFRTVQAAINAVPDYRKAGETRILIRKGVYKEKIVIAESKQNVHLIGEDGTVLTYDDYASKTNAFGENKGTSGSGSIYIYGPDFVAENITFQNSAGPVGQAVACHVPIRYFHRVEGIGKIYISNSRIFDFHIFKDKILIELAVSLNNVERFVCITRRNLVMSIENFHDHKDFICMETAFCD